MVCRLPSVGCRRLASTGRAWALRAPQGAIHIRVGFHTGPIVGTLVGTTRRKYTLLGGTAGT